MKFFLTPFLCVKGLINIHFPHALTFHFTPCVFWWSVVSRLVGVFFLPGVFFPTLPPLPLSFAFWTPQGPNLTLFPVEAPDQRPPSLGSFWSPVCSELCSLPWSLPFYSCTNFSPFYPRILRFSLTPKLFTASVPFFPFFCFNLWNCSPFSSLFSLFLSPSKSSFAHLSRWMRPGPNDFKQQLQLSPFPARAPPTLSLQHWFLGWSTSTLPFPSWLLDVLGFPAFVIRSYLAWFSRFSGRSNHLGRLLSTL